MSNQAIKERIRKLLNLAHDDGAADAEAESALRFARRLMLAHNVDESDIEQPRDPHEMAADVEYGSVDHYTTGARLSQWESTLAWSIVELIGTVGHYISGTGEARTPHGTLDYDDRGQTRKARRIAFYGPEEDCRDAVEMLREWTLTISAMARLRYGGALRGEGRSYAEGFTAALWDKVKTMKREERKAIEEKRTMQIGEGQECTALVLAGAHELMVAKKEKGKEWLASQGIKLGRASGRGGGEHHGSAYRAGRSDGSRAQLTRGRREKITG